MGPETALDKNDPQPKTSSALTLMSVMKRLGLNTKRFRDYCMITNAGVIDHAGFVACTTNHDEIPELVHKRELHKKIGKVADQWWHKKLGIRKVR